MSALGVVGLAALGALLMAMVICASMLASRCDARMEELMRRMREEGRDGSGMGPQ